MRQLQECVGKVQYITHKMTEIKENNFTTTTISIQLNATLVKLPYPLSPSTLLAVTKASATFLFLPP